MNLWFSEDQTNDLRLSVRVKEVLHHERTPYQELLVVDTVEWGRMLALDDVIQTNERTEFVYHEMMAHVPLFTHPDPQRVLVIGGGDGGVVREVLKHPTVREVVLAEIDERVVEAAKRYLPSLSTGLEDPRCRLAIGDGIAHVNASPDAYDVIIVDSTDPVGPAEGLFGEPFYRAVERALRPGGVFVAQTESPFYTGPLLVRVRRALRRVFPKVALYWGVVPEYPGGFWTMSLGSKGPDPLSVPAERYEERRFAGFATKYYSPAMHRAAFTLPPFVEELLAEADAGGDADEADAPPAGASDGR